MEFCHYIVNDLIIKSIQHCHRNYCTDNSQNNSFNYKWNSYKEIRCTNQLHNSNLFLSYRNTHCDSIADKEKCGAKTLFATHYHELTELENQSDGIKNYSIAVKEKGEDIIFLRKIVRGGTDESYGIHVAKLAGVPKIVTQKANEFLSNIEKKNVLTGKKAEKEDKKKVEGQFDMYNYKLAEIAHELDKVNLNELTPIDALNTLVKIKEKMK